MYAQKPDFEKAATGFKNIFEKGDGNFKDEAYWYYALACIKLGRNDEAKQNLVQYLQTLCSYKQIHKFYIFCTDAKPIFLSSSLKTEEFKQIVL